MGEGRGGGNAVNRFFPSGSGITCKRSHQAGFTEGGRRLPSAAGVDGDHFLFLRISEVVRIRGGSTDSIYQQWSADLLALPGSWDAWRHAVFGRFGMDVWHAALPRVLEQEAGHPRGAGLDRHVRR